MLHIVRKSLDNLYITPSSAFPINQFKEEINTKPESFRQISMIVIDPELDITTYKNLEREFHKNRKKYKLFSKINNSDQFYVIDKKNNAVNLIKGNKNTGWTFTRYEIGKLNSKPSDRVRASITEDGYLRFYRADMTSDFMVTKIKGGSFNFDNGIALDEVRIKLSSGKLVPLLSKLKGFGS